MALLNTVASSAPMMARREGEKHDRRHAGLPRARRATARKDPRRAAPRIRRSTVFAAGLHRRWSRGSARGAPRSARRRRWHRPTAWRRAPDPDEAVHEIGREQEGDDERVEGLRRPVEQHPAGERERAGLLRRLGPALPSTLTSGHRARSDDWAAHRGRRCPAGNARRESCRRSRSP